MELPCVALTKLAVRVGHVGWVDCMGIHFGVLDVEDNATDEVKSMLYSQIHPTRTRLSQQQKKPLPHKENPVPIILFYKPWSKVTTSRKAMSNHSTRKAPTTQWKLGPKDPDCSLTCKRNSKLARTPIKTLTNFLMTHSVDVTSLDLTSSLEREVEKCASNERKQTTILDFF